MISCKINGNGNSLIEGNSFQRKTELIATLGILQ